MVCPGVNRNSLIALGIAAVMFVWLADQYNNMLFVRRSSAMIEVADLGPVVWVMFILFAVIAGVLAGILPAINMSKHSPVRVLNGPISWTGGRRFTGRKILVVLQFSLSIVAIVMTSVLYNQTRYILAADYGFDQEQLVHVRLGNVSYETLKDELTKIPGIMEVAATSSVPAAGPTYNTTIQIPGEEDVSLIQQFSVDANFLSQYRLPVVAGRNLSPDYSDDKTGSIMITEAALGMLGFESAEDAIGSQVIYEPGLGHSTVTIVGVAGNIYSRGFEDGFVPVAMTLNPDKFEYASLRIAPSSVVETLPAIEAVWRTLAPTVPLQFAYFDEALNQKNRQYKDAIGVLGLFSVLLIAITCMGLFGMASFSAARRKREVGIRKVLGAKIQDVIILLSREYVVLILWAVAVATPLAWILGSLVLQNFANRISLTPGIMIVAVLPIASLAFIAILSQTWKAATSNPVDSIQLD